MTVEKFYEQKYGSREVGGREGEEETEESLKKAREYDDFKGGRLCSEMFVY